MKLLRTPDERFLGLPNFDYEPHYTQTGGLRMAWVEAGEGAPILCLHGEPSWSFLYRKMMPLLAEVGRAVAPDLVGFGRSDKPTERSDYTYQMHYDAVAGFIKNLDLRNITLVCQDWGGLLGLPIAAEMSHRFARLVIMNTGLPTGEEEPTPGFIAWRTAATKMKDMDVGRVIQSGLVSKLSPDDLTAYNAPFPDASYKQGAHQFPLLVPMTPRDEAAPIMKRARQALKSWTKPALVMFSDKDPVTRGGDVGFRRLIPSAKDQPDITIRDAGHFLQEDKGEEIARHIVDFLKRTP